MDALEKISWYRFRYSPEQRASLPRRTKKRIVEDILNRPVRIQATEFCEGLDPIELASLLIGGLQMPSRAST